MKTKNPEWCCKNCIWWTAGHSPMGAYGICRFSPPVDHKLSRSRAEDYCSYFTPENGIGFREFFLEEKKETKK